MNAINSGLKRHTAARTIGALADIEKAKQQLERELLTGEIKARCDEHGRLHLSHQDISQIAGRHWNFLNSKKHKLTTKASVELFLKGLHERYEASVNSKAEISTAKPKRAVRGAIKSEHLRLELEAARAEIKELKMRYEKAVSFAHHWALTLRAAKTEVRLLKSQLKPQVVPLQKL